MKSQNGVFGLLPNTGLHGSHWARVTQHPSVSGVKGGFIARLQGRKSQNGVFWIAAKHRFPWITLGQSDSALVRERLQGWLHHAASGAASVCPVHNAQVK